MKSLFSVIVLSMLLMSSGLYAQNVEDMMSQGELQIKIDNKARKEYNEIRIGICDQCPGKKCELCLTENSSIGIVVEKSNKEFKFKLPEGKYGVYGFKENDSGTDYVMEFLEEVEITPNGKAKLKINGPI